MPDEETGGLSGSPPASSGQAPSAEPSEADLIASIAQDDSADRYGVRETYRDLPEAPEAPQELPTGTEQEQEQQPPQTPAQGVHAAAKAALEAGDVDKALELALGVKSDDLKIDGKKFAEYRKWEQGKKAALQEAQQKADRAMEEAKAERGKVNQQLQQLGQRLQRPIALMNALDAYDQHGDPNALIAEISKSVGDYTKFQQAALRGERMPTGQRTNQMLMQQIQALTQQVQELKNPPPPPPESPEQKAAKAAEQRQRYTQALQTQLQGDPILQMDGGIQEVYREMVGSLDPVLKAPSLTAQQAAERVRQRYAARAKALGFAPAAQQPQQQRPPPSSGVQSPPRQDSAASSWQEENEDDVLRWVASEAQRRGV